MPARAGVIKKLGKDGKLFKKRTTEVSSDIDDPPEIRKKDNQAMEYMDKENSLESVLSRHQREAESILKAYGKPYTSPECWRYNNEKESYQVSVSARIIMQIQLIRQWMQDGNFKAAIRYAIALGENVAMLSAEDAYKEVKERPGKRSGKARREKAKPRQEELGTVTDKLGYKKGAILSRADRKRIRQEFFSVCPEYKDIDHKTFKSDLKTLGLHYEKIPE